MRRVMAKRVFAILGGRVRLGRIRAASTIGSLRLLATEQSRRERETMPPSDEDLVETFAPFATRLQANHELVGTKFVEVIG